MTGDFLQRFLFERLNIRGEIIRLSDTFSTVAANADYPRAVKKLLGEALAAVELMAATVKNPGKLNLQLQGQGAVSLLLVQASNNGCVRGLAHWKGNPRGGSLAHVMGKGRLMISMEPDDCGEHYQGITALEGETLSATLEHYFRRSEQLPTRIWLFARESEVAGFMLQQMPGDAPDPDGWNRVCKLAETVRPDELQQLPVPQLLRRLFCEEDVRLFDERTVRFQCGCSEEKIKRVLASLGKAEMESILAEQGQVEVRCDFCNRLSVFDPVDVAELFAQGIHVPNNGISH